MKSSLHIGLPMIGSLLLGTWGLTRIQQAKFDARDAKKKVISKREKLGISAQPIDPQEIYFVNCK